MCIDLNSEDLNFDELESVVGSKIYCLFYDWFLNHREDGTPFPDVGTLFADCLLEYEKRGGDVPKLVGSSLSRAYITFALD